MHRQSKDQVHQVGPFFDDADRMLPEVLEDAVLAFGMLFSLYKFLRRIEAGQIFVPANVTALRRISWCCVGAAVLCLPAGVGIYLPFSGYRQGEERLSHRSDPDSRIFQGFPSWNKHKFISACRTGQQSHAHSKYDEDQEEKRHHDLVALLDTAGTEQQCKQSADDDNNMEWYNREIRHGERFEPFGSVDLHQ